MGLAGAGLFARYAYPPNALGYCGPADTPVPLRLGPHADRDIARHARQFEGVWVYLELIAAAAHLDPLDHRVVEAYWIGNELLGLIDCDEMARQLRSRLPEQTGASWGPGRAHHSYHVLAVYPWLGLLARTNGRGPALNVLNQCLIRWAEVVAVDGDTVRVAGPALALRDGRLVLAEPAEQTVTTSVDKASPLAGVVSAVNCAPVKAGDVVAIHWDWICGILSQEQLGNLVACTQEQLARASSVLTVS